MSKNAKRFDKFSYVRSNTKSFPNDFEPCGDCGFDHSYEYDAAYQWHIDNPCSYCSYENGLHEKDCCVKGECR